ncbi:hypothetical protein P389DRAFT_108301 [Cystobasidium minutum MCA 4210]|uniref:uncharacterized protein n=1 Tax=Cystobasidium minutum MCA 4210 TaxID=1397322 RepID=UPI0034CE2E66|eukprot:jgi/Rhomi1/108301/CE108300_181
MSLAQKDASFTHSGQTIHAHVASTWGLTCASSPAETGHDKAEIASVTAAVLADLAAETTSIILEELPYEVLEQICGYLICDLPVLATLNHKFYAAARFLLNKHIYLSNVNIEGFQRMLEALTISERAQYIHNIESVTFEFHQGHPIDIDVLEGLNAILREAKPLALSMPVGILSPRFEEPFRDINHGRVRFLHITDIPNKRWHSLLSSCSGTLAHLVVDDKLGYSSLRHLETVPVFNKLERLSFYTRSDEDRKDGDPFQLARIINNSPHLHILDIRSWYAHIPAMVMPLLRAMGPKLRHLSLNHKVLQSIENETLANICPNLTILRYVDAGLSSFPIMHELLPMLQRIELQQIGHKSIRIMVGGLSLPSVLPTLRLLEIKKLHLSYRLTPSQAADLSTWQEIASRRGIHHTVFETVRDSWKGPYISLLL